MKKYKELTLQEIKIREKSKSKKERGKEIYKVKGTNLNIKYIGHSRPKKKEVN